MSLSLGIDVGTSSVKSILYDNSRGTLASVVKEVNSKEETGIKYEQNVSLIIKALMACLQEIDGQASLFEVDKIAICGQMHGILFWFKKGQSWRWGPSQDAPLSIKQTSNLITWEDKRCDTEFLSSLPKSNIPVASGYGCASLMWMQKYEPDKLKDYQRCGSISDFIVCALCDLDQCFMSDQMAYSWGYYEQIERTWQGGILPQDSPLKLPSVIPVGTIAGHLTKDLYGLKSGIPVYVASGDSQSAVLSTGQQTHEAVLNLGTSCQLSMQVEKIPVNPPTEHVQYWPYHSGKHLAVAASLNGGNVLAGFVEMLHQWITALDCEATVKHIWEKLIYASILPTSNSPIMISPLLHGERITPDARASVNNISPNNTSVGDIYGQLCVSLVENIHSMMPNSYLKSMDVTSLVCVGSVFQKQPRFVEIASRVFEMNVRVVEVTDAPLGAILMILN